MLPCSVREGEKSNSSAIVAALTKFIVTSGVRKTAMPARSASAASARGMTALRENTTHGIRRAHSARNRAGRLPARQALEIRHLRAADDLDALGGEILEESRQRQPGPVDGRLQDFAVEPAFRADQAQLQVLGVVLEELPDGDRRPLAVQRNRRQRESAGGFTGRNGRVQMRSHWKARLDQTVIAFFAPVKHVDLFGLGVEEHDELPADISIWSTASSTHIGLTGYFSVWMTSGSGRRLRVAFGRDRRLVQFLERLGVEHLFFEVTDGLLAVGPAVLAAAASCTCASAGPPCRST